MTTLTASIKLSLIDQMSRPMQSIGGQLDTLKTKFQAVGKTFSVAGQMNQAAEAMGRFRGAVQGALAAPGREFIDFEQSMSRVAALSGEVGTEGFAKLKAQALELGSATSFTASEAAGAMSEFAMAGRSANEILSVVPTTLSLAKASGTDLARSAEILGSTMAALGLPASESERAANVLTRAFTGSATSLESLGESMKFVAPIAKQANTPIETVAAALGALGNAGVRGSEAGTAMRALFTRLVGPMRLAKKEFQAIGLTGNKLVEVQNRLTSGDFIGVFREIGSATEGLTDARRLEVLKRVFGQESLSAASILIDASIDTGEKGLESLIAAMNDTSKSAKRTALVMEDNTAGSLTRLSSAWSGFLIKTGEQLAPAINRWSEMAQGGIAVAADWVSKNADAIETFGKAAFGAVVLVGGIQAVTLAGSVATSAFGLMRGATVLASSGVSMMAIGVKGLGVAAIATGRFLMGATTIIGMLMKGEIALSVVRTAIMKGTILPMMAGLKAAAATILGPAGLVVAAAAAGYYIGKWADATWGLSDKLMKAIDKVATFFGADSVFQEQGNANEVEYADGTVVDQTTGRVVTLGQESDNAAAPKWLQDARAAGATGIDEVNRYRARTAPPELPAGSVVFNPVVERAAKAVSFAGSPDFTTASDPEATENQRRQIDKAKEQTELMREQMDELRKLQRVIRQQMRSLPSVSGF